MNVILSYRQIGIICATINMYCNGPEYHYTCKDLTNEEKKIGNMLWDRFHTTQKKIIDANPNDFQHKPYSNAAKNNIGTIIISEYEQNLLIRIIETTLNEALHDTPVDYELELFVASRNELLQCLKFLK